MRSLLPILLACLVVLCACSPTAVTPTVAAPTSEPTLVPATPEPTAPPTLTPFPTPAELAPEETFTSVGNVAELTGSHEVAGKAIVAGLQTIIIQGFTFDGKGPQADLRLVKGSDAGNPAAILHVLEQRPYTDEFLLVRIPASAGPGTADSLAVYCPETSETYALAKFQ